MDDICANCNAPLTGPYCAQCGEPRLQPDNLGFRHFIHECLHEFTHVDGRLGPTLRLLFTRPGALPEAYLAGRRTGLIRPLRLYLFLSIPVVYLAKSVLSLQTLVAAGGKAFAPAIAWGARQAGLDEAAYLARRAEVFQVAQNFSTTYVSTALLIVGCFLLWRRRRPHFGEHAVFLLYTASATDIIATGLTWLFARVGGSFAPLGSMLALGFMSVYFVLAARRVYGEGLPRTILKVLLLTGFVLVYGMASLLVLLLVTLPIFQASRAG